jgi:hypothetical protein
MAFPSRAKPRRAKEMTPGETESSLGNANGDGQSTLQSKGQRRDHTGDGQYQEIGIELAAHQLGDRRCRGA